MLIFNYIRCIINPNHVYFPIFWLPIIIPLTFSAFGLILELSTRTKKKDSLNQKINNETIMVLISRYLIFSFLSTDVWALTTLMTDSVKPEKEIHGIYILSLSFGVLIGLMIHFLFYLIVVSFKEKRFEEKYERLCIIPMLILSLVGVLLIRSSVFIRIELTWLKSIEPDNQEIQCLLYTLPWIHI